jgi:hypothetical protein
MPWTFKEIEGDWTPGTLTIPEDEIVSAFDRVEKILGRDWIEMSRTSSGVAKRGSAPTLSVISMGQKLATIEDLLPQAERLIEHTRKGDQAAGTELTAIYLLRSRRPTAEIQLYPSVGNRVADFRIRQGGEPWVYGEVTRADLSMAESRAQNVMQGLADLVISIKKEFALEVFLRREPSAIEIEALKGFVQAICKLDGVHRQELPNDLGFISLNDSPPGQVITKNHPGEENRPRIGVAKVASGPLEPNRHIAVRLAFSDERAEEFLRKESRQLPEDAPGLIMVDMSIVPGAFSVWEPLIKRRFQPTIHTRVGGVCLFRGGLISTQNGEGWALDAKTLANQYARNPLPSWIVNEMNETGLQVEQAIFVRKISVQNY